MTKETRIYKQGDRVRLLPFEEEPEQIATVLGPPENGMYIVRLDKEYLADSLDDGLRELDAEQMEPL